MSNVTVTGTATDFAGLFNALRDFLTTDATLVTNSENWTQIYGPVGTLTVDDQIVLEGPGLAGADTIRVGIGVDYNDDDDRYNLAFRGHTSWNNQLSDDDQIGKSNWKYIPAWNGSIPYRFVANGRCFKVKMQVSTVWTAGYAGFFLQLGTKSEYPYPLAIGGSTDVATTKYSSTNIEFSHFVNPHNSLEVCFPDGVWRSFENFYNSSNSYAWRGDRVVSPYENADGSSGNSGARADVAALRKNLDGTYPLIRTALHVRDPGNAVLGYLDGVYHVPGIENSANNVLTQGGNSYEVVQNVFRTDNHLGYWALQLD